MKVKTDVKAGGVEPSPFRAVVVFQIFEKGDVTIEVDEDGFIVDPG